MSDTQIAFKETILVVDDDESILKVVVLILKSARFNVLSAGSGPEAIRLAQETAGDIDLLLSDVHMPDISGPDLGEELKRSRPNLRVMLMSGAANGKLLGLNYGWSFIDKPFVPERLVQMVKHVLFSPDKSQLRARIRHQRVCRLTIGWSAAGAFRQR